MEEDGDIKAAPVTRLRRRLSVEQPESPSTPATPTKKRAARLAAKPQLELIDEHAVTNSPSKRTTRKSISRDLADPEEKLTTPARRSTRVKSNTSLVSEADEKPATPARRTTRVKSNTSLVSEVEDKPATPAKRAARVKSNTSVVSAEVTQGVDTPRAKRAARRNSQIGSDTETPLTPARTRKARKNSTSSVDNNATPSVSETAITPGRTRRTRKGSTSSIDNIPAEASPADKPASIISDVIPEEPENKLSKSSSEPENTDEKTESPIRKSPRLMAKKVKKRGSGPNEQNENELIEINKETESDLQTSQILNVTSDTTQDISLCTKNLIKDLDTKIRKQISDKNKSLSDMEGLNTKNKRNRTKSWTTLTSPARDFNFCSDNESTKKRVKKHGKHFGDKEVMQVSSGDGPKEISKVELNIETMIQLNTSKNNKTSKESRSNKYNDSKVEVPMELNLSNDSNKENITVAALNKKESSAVDIMLESAPSEVKTTVLLEDSDSNTESIGKPKENQDQHVHNETNNDKINIFEINSSNVNDDSVEPMDIDETIPENISLTVFGEGNKKSRKSSLILQDHHLSKETNESGRNSLKVHVSQTESSSNFSLNISKDVPANESSRKSIATQPTVNNVSVEKSKKSKRISQSFPKNSDAADENKTNSIIDRNDVSETQEVKNNKSGRTSLSTSETKSVHNEKSKRKSSLSHSLVQNDSKSTLVLSQIKDVSATDDSTSKSPRPSNDKTINTSQIIKDIPNKNLTLNYLTSTPVQQKHMEKLSIQINTSVITPTSLNKAVKDKSDASECDEIGYKKKKIKRLSDSTWNESKAKSTPKNDVSLKSNTDYSSSEDEDQCADKSSGLLDDEAEDAGNDYESGDSQNDEEREYERNNEIVEKGETITSEDESSNDSDYEKDSFLVSSDEEDEDLLSGSGDDLDMSDNELRMSAKSKKKFNERKLKEQKQASREMYNSRHGLNNSEQDNSTAIKNKKNSRSRLDSNLLKSDDDNLPPKKNKRMRLESSTLETSYTKSEEDSPKNKSNVTEPDVGYKKKKNKRLSESVCNESALNEKEISVYNPQSNDTDPLSVKVKQEPKTPRKSVDLSTVNIHEEVEQVEVDENVSIMKTNITTDPLQSTMAQEDISSSDDASISENEEISSNYESMLKQLNKDTKTQIKTHDLSLNLDKRSKKKKEHILEELNLTHTKLFRKEKNDSKEAKEKSVKRVFKKLAENDNSNESVDLKLLFSDDSNDKTNQDNVSDNASIENIIPLKKSQAKTDIRESAANNEETLNTSSSKNKKRKSNKGNESEPKSSGIYNDEEGILNFFIDTKGDLPVDESETRESDEHPVEIYYKSNKNKKHSRNYETTDNTESVNHETSISTKSPVSEKSNSELKTLTPQSVKTPISEKKKKVSESFIISESNALKTPGSSKKTKHSVAKTDEPTEVTKTPFTEKKKKSEIEKLEESPIPKGEKTKINKSETSEDITITGTVQENISSKMRKRKSSANKSTGDIDVVNTSQSNESIISNKKKKQKISRSMDEDEIHSEMMNKKQGPDAKKDQKTEKEGTEQQDEMRYSKKRKHRGDDESEKKSKVFKEHSFDKIHVPRLPSSIIAKLDDKLPKVSVSKNTKVVSTTEFIVEEAKKRKNKPSVFLEESVYLNNNDIEEVSQRKTVLKKPKVLPFMPTVSTSDSGFTTNFKVNVISEKMEFVAQTSDIPNFKKDYLNNRRLKKLRTYDHYKKQRNLKLSKF